MDKAPLSPGVRIGFTGTRWGMSAHQEQIVRRILTALRPEVFIHGDCVGADEQAHNIACDIGLPILIYPPINPLNRAYCRTGADLRIMPAGEYLDRNHKIVDQCNGLIATPKDAYQSQRSGTWATVRYAQRSNKPVTVIYPTGEQINIYALQED